MFSARLGLQIAGLPTGVHFINHASCWAVKFRRTDVPKKKYTVKISDEV
jgi:hypothetical protein